MPVVHPHDDLRGAVDLSLIAATALDDRLVLLDYRKAPPVDLRDATLMFLAESAAHPAVAEIAQSA
jgi:hypothetical protein